jgi:hypothetical protein
MNSDHFPRLKGLREFGLSAQPKNHCALNYPEVRTPREPVMLRQVLIFISAIGLSMPAVAQDKALTLPKNTIDCRQFKKTGPQQWMEVGTAVFDLGEITDINLTDQPVTPGYFKFGGIELYPVLEAKCGAPASNTAAAPQALSIAASDAPKEELELSRGESKIAQISEHAPISENKDSNLKSQSENNPCPANKLVYAANGVGDTEGVASVIELVFESKHKEDLETAANSEFEIREYRNNLIEWTYKGRFLQKKNNTSRFDFELFQSRKRKPVALEPHYIKPNRDGTGEPILYVVGLHNLSASKKNGHASKTEGKRPNNALPEVFYFERCE